MSNKKNPDELVETFKVRHDQGAVALMVGLSKPGYELIRVERKGTKAKVYFKKKMTTKRPFITTTKHQYDPKVEGYGYPYEWKAAFKERMGLDAAKAEVGNGSPYEILGVASTATWAQVKKAYRVMVMKHHPDKGGDPAVFRKIQGAYEVLEDVYSRR